CVVASAAAHRGTTGLAAGQKVLGDLGQRCLRRVRCSGVGAAGVRPDVGAHSRHAAAPATKTEAPSIPRSVPGSRSEHPGYVPAEPEAATRQTLVGITAEPPTRSGCARRAVVVVDHAVSARRSPLRWPEDGVSW